MRGHSAVRLRRKEARTGEQVAQQRYCPSQYAEHCGSWDTTCETRDDDDSRGYRGRARFHQSHDAIED